MVDKLWLVLAVMLVQSLYCFGQNTSADMEEYRKRGQAIIRRIAAASATNHIRPTLIVSESPGIAHFDLRDRSITADARLFQLADRTTKNPDVVLAYILGHEYAHYIRGHDFDYHYRHTFGEILEKGEISEDLNNILAVSRQKEYEADYYGMYFCYLAGYRFTLQELTSFMEAMKNEFGGGADYAFTHPAWASRKLVVESVINEFEQRACSYYAAICLLQNRNFDEAAAIFDWINSTVPIVDVQWNELIARVLIAQKALNRTIIADDDVIGAANLRPVYRGKTPKRYTILDAEIQLDKAESLVQALKSSHNPPESVNTMDTIVQLLRFTKDCSSCDNTTYCQEHKPMVKAVNYRKRGFVAFNRASVSTGDIESKLRSVRTKFQALSKYTNDKTLDLGRFDVELHTASDKLRLSGLFKVCEGYECKTITLLMESCPTCKVSEMISRDSHLFIQTEGQRLYFSITNDE